MGLVSGIIGTAVNSGLSFAQRDWNEKMYDKQKQFWYEQQEYNSPENQVERLKAAGINPQFALGNITSGQLGSSPTVPTMSPTQAGNFAGATDSILSLINNKRQQNVLDSEAKLKQSDATLNEIDAITRLTKNIQEIKESMSREDKNRMDEFMTNILGTVEEQLMRSQVANNAADNGIKWLNFAKGLKELQFLPTQQRLEYVERMESIANMRAVTASEKQRKILLIQQTNHEFFKSKGQKFVNSLDKKTEQFLINKRSTEQWHNNPFGFFFEYMGQ